MDDPNAGRVPELEGVTPEQALELSNSPVLLDAWMARMHMTRPPRGFFGVLARLANEAVDARADAQATIAQTGRQNSVNRRRKDVPELVRLFEGCGERLPLRLRQVYLLCIDAGRSISDTAAALDISRNTVRVHLRRLRDLARRNAHVRPVESTGGDRLAALGYGRSAG